MFGAYLLIATVLPYLAYCYDLTEELRGFVNVCLHSGKVLHKVEWVVDASKDTHHILNAGII